LVDDLMVLPPKEYCDIRGPPDFTNITEQSLSENEETRETFVLSKPYQYMDGNNEK